MRAEKGSILLLSLMIMTSVMIASVGISSLILGSLKQTRTLDNAAIAYYAAESGIEEALYEARRTDVLPVSKVNILMNNKATWTRTITATEPRLFAGSVLKDGTVEIDLYDHDNPTTATGITSIKVDWTDTCTGCSVLQATLVGWQTSVGGSAWVPNAATTVTPQSAAGATLSLDPSKLFKLRLTAKKADLQNISITAYSGSGQVDIPGRLKILSVGDFVNTRQSLTATIPHRAPLSGLFDYVIFSECSLVKGGLGSCPN